MTRVRTNIGIDKKLHAIAAKHAREVHKTDFSGLVTKLIIADLGEAYMKENLSSPADEAIAALRRTMAAEDERLRYGPRAQKKSVVDREKE